jgi:anthranilate synthase component II
MKAALIDNYDSFTYNLKAQIELFGIDVDVFRNDKVKMEALALYDFIVLSPGPSLPQYAGKLLPLIDYYKFSKPILGVCLGMQGMGQIFGGKLKLLDKPLHGISRCVKHFGDPIFKGVEKEFLAARYHSWVISQDDLPMELSVIAVSENEMIMAIKHVDFPLYGFQFHPESILTDVGDQLIQNFIEQVKLFQNETIIREAI